MVYSTGLLKYLNTQHPLLSSKAANARKLDSTSPHHEQQQLADMPGHRLVQQSATARMHTRRLTAARLWAGWAMTLAAHALLL
jgi:hypothetical protein